MLKNWIFFSLLRSSTLARLPPLLPIVFRVMSKAAKVKKRRREGRRPRCSKTKRRIFFFHRGVKNFFSCVHRSKMLPGDVMFLAAMAWMKEGDFLKCP